MAMVSPMARPVASSAAVQSPLRAAGSTTPRSVAHARETQRRGAAPVVCGHRRRGGLREQRDGRQDHQRQHQDAREQARARRLERLISGTRTISPQKP